MTIGTNPDAIPARRRWAAEVLGVRESASPAEVRRAYLGKLRECEFVPPRSWQQALRVLVGDPAPAESDVEWLIEEEDRLRAEVVSFAEEFFTLPVAQRRERWDALLSQCRDVPPLAARLQALNAGLVVESRALPADQPFAGRLAEHMLESFPLPAPARAAARQRFLRRIEESAADSHKPWEQAARYLRAEWPALAALDDGLVRHVAQLRGHLKRREATHSRSQRNREPVAASGGNKRSPWWGLLVAAGLAAGVLRGVTSSDHSSPSRAPLPDLSAPRDGAGLKDVDDLRLRIGTDSRTGQTKIFSGLPPIQELLDSSKYDVEVIDPGAGGRVFRFTPRVNSIARAASGGQPVWLGEATLRIMEVSPEQMDALCSSAAKGKPREADPAPRNSSRGDEVRP